MDWKISQGENCCMAKVTPNFKAPKRKSAMLFIKAMEADTKKTGTDG